MSDDLASANSSDDPGTTTNFAAAVVTEQIERLRGLADDLDRQYASRIKKGRLKLKDGMAYLAVRERVASKIVDFTGDLCRLRSPDLPTNADAPADATGSDSGGALSWDPDADPGSEFPQATR